jgi:uncharacterized protein (TIGR02284 family)
MGVTYDVTSTLNELIETCLDGRKGFETAAGAIDDAALKAELAGYAAQRQDFAADLKGLVAAFGEDPPNHGHLAAAAHRGWINLRNAITTNDRAAILAECERGEDYAVGKYRAALSAGLPPEYAQVVQTQYAAVQRTHDRVKALRDAAKRPG